MKITQHKYVEQELREVGAGARFEAARASAGGAAAAEPAVGSWMRPKASMNLHMHLYQVQS